MGIDLSGSLKWQEMAGNGRRQNHPLQTSHNDKTLRMDQNYASIWLSLFIGTAVFSVECSVIDYLCAQGKELSNFCSDASGGVEIPTVDSHQNTASSVVWPAIKLYNK